jgi:hypothetical protein
MKLRANDIAQVNSSISSINGQYVRVLKEGVRNETFNGKLKKKTFTCFTYMVEDDFSKMHYFFETELTNVVQTI